MDIAKLQEDIRLLYPDRLIFVNSASVGVRKHLDQFPDKLYDRVSVTLDGTEYAVVRDHPSTHEKMLNDISEGIKNKPN